MNERVMRQLGISISQPNIKHNFTLGIIKDLTVAFHTFPDVSFKIDVMVIDALSSWGILLSKYLVTKIGGIFQYQG